MKDMNVFWKKIKNVLNKKKKKSNIATIKAIIQIDVRNKNLRIQIQKYAPFLEINALNNINIAQIIKEFMNKYVDP